jgi:hypothetical protein
VYKIKCILALFSITLFHSVEIDGEEEGEHVSRASYNQSRGINNHNVYVRRNGLKHVTFDIFLLHWCLISKMSPSSIPRTSFELSTLLGYF